MNINAILLFLSCFFAVLSMMLSYKLYEMEGKITTMQRLYNIEEDFLKKEAHKFEHANKLIEEAFGIHSNKPEGCVPGEYCGACQFGKIVMVYSGYGAYDAIPYCAKGECCDYFVERKIEE